MLSLLPPPPPPFSPAPSPWWFFFFAPLEETFFSPRSPPASPAGAVGAEGRGGAAAAPLRGRCPRLPWRLPVPAPPPSLCAAGPGATPAPGARCPRRPAAGGKGGRRPAPRQPCGPCARSSPRCCSSVSALRRRGREGRGCPGGTGQDGTGPLVGAVPRRTSGRISPCQRRAPVTRSCHCPR